MKKKLGPRAKAKLKGATTYYNDKPCPQGHVGLRLVSNGSCVKCKREYNKAYQRMATPKARGNLLRKSYRTAQKKRVMDHYGGLCRCCSEDELIFLNIDHVGGGGNKHRWELSGRRNGCGNFYAWLINNGFPPGYQVLCFNCNFAMAQLGQCPHEHRRAK